MLRPIVSASLEYDQGITTVLYILSQLGVVTPEIVDADVVRAEFGQTLMLLQGKSREDLISLPIMSDANELVCTFLNSPLRPSK